MSYLNNSSSSNYGAQNIIRILSKQKAGLNICHINAQSLKNKIDEFRNIFEQSGVDIICVSETWFNASITDNIISIYGYNVYRNDRGTLGGGVAIFIKNNISCKVIHKSEENEKIESIFVESIVNTKRMLIGCVYRPNRQIDYNSLISFLHNKTVYYDDLIIAGDINSNILRETHFADAINSIGLYSVNTTIATHYTTTINSLLDIFLVANTNNVLLYDQVSVPCFSRHDLIFLCYKAQRPIISPPKPFMNFQKINQNILIHEISGINWEHIYSITTVDEQLIFLNDNIRRIQNCSVPIQTPSQNKNRSCWFTPTIKLLIEQRDMAH